MYGKILVPIDLSHPEQGSAALEIARRLAGEQTQVSALYVAPDVPGFVEAQLPQGLTEEHIAAARVELAALADKVGAESEVRAGHPPTVILEYAKQIGANLIVIASHRPGFQDYLLGSTAARVVRHAQCSVLVER